MSGRSMALAGGLALLVLVVVLGIDPDQLQAIQECSEFLPEGGSPGAFPGGLELPAQ